MRITSYLFGNTDRYTLRFKLAWAVQGKRKILENPIPKLLIAKGVPIIDAQKLVEPPAEQLEIIKIPEPWCPPQPFNKTHPKWKPVVCHIHSIRTKMAEGMLQAQLLTNTVVNEGLPKRIADLVGVADKEDQDELVQRCIVNSQVYDGWQVRLPKKIDIKRPGIHFSKPYGVPESRKLQLLLRYLLRLAESQTGNYPGVLERSIFSFPEFVITSQKYNDLLQFNTKMDLLVTSKEPLKPFASEEEVAKVNSTELPDLYPVKYTIDLIKTNIYDTADFFPFSKTFSNPYVHTLYIAHKFGEHAWSKDRKLAKAVTACYTAAASQARWLYGDVKDLPKPIAVQCVVNKGPVFTLVAYQLNTLSLDANHATRNMAWISPEMSMYEVCDEEIPGKVVFEGYNPEVYRWLLAMHLNGSTSSQLIPTSHLMPSMNVAAAPAQPEQV